MNKILTIVIISIVLVSCKSKQPSILGTTSNPFQSSANLQPLSSVDGYSMNKDYGLKGEFPIKVGDKSPGNQQRYIAALAGPNGEVLSFHRRGSCCPYDSPNGFGGSALVDVYEVTYEGLDEPILLYISFYDFEKLYIPKGFTKRQP